MASNLIAMTSNLASSYVRSFIPTEAGAPQRRRPGSANPSGVPPAAPRRSLRRRERVCVAMAKRVRVCRRWRRCKVIGRPFGLGFDEFGVFGGENTLFGHITRVVSRAYIYMHLYAIYTLFQSNFPPCSPFHRLCLMDAFHRRVKRQRTPWLTHHT